MPLAKLNRVVLFAHEISLIQPRLLTDEFFARFRWSCLSLPQNLADKKYPLLQITHTSSGARAMRGLGAL